MAEALPDGPDWCAMLYFPNQMAGCWRPVAVTHASVLCAWPPAGLVDFADGRRKSWPVLLCGS